VIPVAASPIGHKQRNLADANDCGQPGKYCPSHHAAHIYGKPIANQPPLPKAKSGGTARSGHWIAASGWGFTLEESNGIGTGPLYESPEIAFANGTG
jgi:hypothetical protein